MRKNTMVDTANNKNPSSRSRLIRYFLMGYYMGCEEKLQPRGQPHFHLEEEKGRRKKGAGKKSPPLCPYIPTFGTTGIGISRRAKCRSNL
jgi:hypothetical protein